MNAPRSAFGAAPGWGAAAPAGPPSTQSREGPRRSAGFTLVEVLVALFILSILAMLSWRALDGMARVQGQVFGHSDQTLALQAGLSQWTADLDALQETQLVNAVDFDGRLLRITRRAPLSSEGAIVVAAWALMPGAGGPALARWSSAPLATRGELRQAWQQAAAWSQSGGTGSTDGDGQARAASVAAARALQILFYRNNAWTNPLSSAQAAAEPGASGPGGPGNTAADTGLQAVPDGVRLTLTLAGGTDGDGLSGPIVRDWVRPIVGGGS